MTTAERDPPPSTPDATVAVVQSRTGEAAEADPGELGPDVCRPGLGTRFRLGRGVERAPRTGPYERRTDDPLYRPLRIFTLDPAASGLEGAVATVNVPYEPLKAGPAGSLVEVEPVLDGRDRGGGKEVSADLEDPKVLLQSGYAPSVSDRAFHQQMVYAVTSTVYAAFQKALGRHLAWGFDRPEPARLLLRPHGFKGPNAYYDKANGAISFGYYSADQRVTGRNPPFGTVYTCLSHDIIAHEVTHALLDGLRSHFTYPSNADVLAFHEAFADSVSLFQHFSYEAVVRAAVRRQPGGRLQDSSLLGTLARQFGETTGHRGALRSAIADLDEAGMPRRVYDPHAEPHDLGSVLVGALFEAFGTLFDRKTAPYVRLATNGTGRLPPGDIPADLQTVLAEEASRLANQFLTISIRAIDYCPPVNLELGEFLRALITADHDLVPDDKWGYREALVDAFWRREIYPPDVESLSEDALLWRPPVTDLQPVKQLTFAELRFDGDPCRPAGAGELRRQACALAQIATRSENLAEFGLAPADHPDLEGDTVDLPSVESIRSARRVGPDGQIVFDLVAEIIQRRTARSADGRRTFSYYGGATVILGPDGRIRYVISKSVLNRARLDRQRAYMDDQGRKFWVDRDAAGAAEHDGEGGDRVHPRQGLFQLLHEVEGACPRRPSN